MPHSSGGGSHGGGFHGGSFGGGFHGGSSGGNHEGRRTSRNYFAGGRHYHYWYRGRECSVYADYDLVDRSEKWPLYTAGVILITVLLVFIFSLTFPLPERNYSTFSPTIYDSGNVIKDKGLVMEAMTDFYNRTGIPIYLVTNTETVVKNSAELQQQAYDMYLYYFGSGNYMYPPNSENEWLILYTELTAEAIEAKGGRDAIKSGLWAFEGMQGNNTDSILTKKITKIFNREFYRNLQKMSPDEAFVATLNKITPKTMKRTAGLDFANMNWEAGYWFFMIGLLDIYLAFIAIRGFIFCRGNVQSVVNVEKNPKSNWGD